MTQRVDALPAGYELDRYRIERVLGDGGFGITYLAYHIRMGDAVAIKEYLPIEFAIREAKTTVLPRGGKGNCSRGSDKQRLILRQRHSYRYLFATYSLCTSCL